MKSIKNKRNPQSDADKRTPSAMLLKSMDLIVMQAV